MGAATVAWYRSDLGGLVNPVSTWPDQSGNGFDLTQGTAGFRPALVASGGPNGRPSVLFDGTDDRLVNAALNRPAPATTPTFFWAVLRQVTWSGGDRFWGMDPATTNRMVVFANGVTPDLSGNNAVASTPVTSQLTINTYKGLYCLFTGSTSDYIQVAGGTKSTGINTGNTDPAAGFTLGAQGNGVSNSNVEICELAIFSAEPTPAQFAMLDSYRAALYGLL